LPRRRVELQEVEFHKFVNFHDCGFVTATVAVVGRGEDRDHIALVRPVIAVHDELMGSCDTYQVVGVIKLFTNILAEGVAGTTR